MHIFERLVSNICISLLLLFATMHGQVFAAGTDAADTLTPKQQLSSTFLPENSQFEVLLATSYRQDSLRWSIAGSSVNILSELQWQKLDIAQISATASLSLQDNWSLRGKLDYGNIYSGKNQDSDYNGNYRTQEFSRSNNGAGGGTRDASFGLAYTQDFFNSAGTRVIMLTPKAGISYHRQLLLMTDEFQTLPATGPFPGLNSSYDAQWLSIWVGMESLFRMNSAWQFMVSVEMHQVDYLARADWNLRTDFAHPVSFTHSAVGSGFVLAAGVNYAARQNWKADITATLQRWETGTGVDRTYFANGTVGVYPLNEVVWESASVGVSATRYFE